MLPAELLSVDYAKPIRDFLCTNFEAVTIIAFDERVFPGVLADTVLLLAEKQSSSRGISLVRLKNLAELPPDPTTLQPPNRLPATPSIAKWTPLLLPEVVRSTYAEVAGATGVIHLGEVFRVDIGIVSGANGFFVMTQDQVMNHVIPKEDLIPILSGSRQLLGSHFGPREFDLVRSAGQGCWLLNLTGKSDISPATKAYLGSGEAKQYSSGYKTGSRRRWFDVPSVYAPDGFMSYFISEGPRFVTNLVGATSTNTIHRMRLLRSEPKAASTYVLACYSTLTSLSSEVEGRSYGGGVAKLETKEAERLSVVRPSANSTKELLRLEIRVHDALVRGDSAQATALVDQVLLEGQLSLSKADRSQLASGLEALRARRRARMRRPTSEKD